MKNIDPTRCPICHEPNVCAAEKAKATGGKPERCWCMDAVFTLRRLVNVENVLCVFYAVDRGIFKINFLELQLGTLSSLSSRIVSADYV